jgi:hypothetical protein
MNNESNTKSTTSSKTETPRQCIAKDLDKAQEIVRSGSDAFQESQVSSLKGIFEHMGKQLNPTHFKQNAESSDHRRVTSP